MFKRLLSRLTVLCLRRGRKDVNFGIKANRRCCSPDFPKALLEQLNAKADDSLNNNFEDGKLVINPKKKLRKLPKYDLSELLLSTNKSWRV